MGTLEHLDEWRLRAYLHQEVAKKCQTKQRAKKAKVYSFEKGQLVLLFDARHELFPGKLSHVWSGPYRIVEVFPKNKAQLAEMDGTWFATKTNFDKMKPYWM